MREDFGADWDKLSPRTQEQIRAYIRGDIAAFDILAHGDMKGTDQLAKARQAREEKLLRDRGITPARSTTLLGEARSRLFEADGPNYDADDADDQETHAPGQEASMERHPSNGPWPGEPVIDLALFQEQVHAWCLANFGKQSDLVLYGGTAEEAGELLRGAVKREQGIRGSRAEWDSEIRKEMGDIVIKLASIAGAEGWSLIDIINDRWADVRKRIWSGADKTGHGLPEDES